LKGFATELKCIDKAAQFSLENILTDVRELEKGMDLTKRELENRLNAPIQSMQNKEQQRLKSEQNKSLQEFVNMASEKVSKLRSDANNAQSSFKDCAEYFGEDPKTGDCNTFFSVIVRFIATWKSAEEDNVKRQKLLEAENRKNQAGNPEDSQKRPETAANMKNAMINELKTRNNRNLMVKPGVNEIQDGTFEGIILDMKSQPYRNEGMHRSFRRHKKTPSESMTVTTNETEPL